MRQDVVANHDFRNWLHTVLLLGSMLLLLTLLGWLVAGQTGILWSIILGGILVILGQQVSPQLVLRMYQARPLTAAEAPELYRIVEALAQRAELAFVPVVYYIPSRMLNAFAVGTRRNAAIGLTDGILRSLDLRELTGVLAHEMSHIRNNDMRSMNIADVISRITNLFSTFGKFLLLLNFPLILMGRATISWWAILLLIFAPMISGLLQLALSRTREFDADLDAIQLTHDPVGLMNALQKLEYYSTNIWQQVLFPGRGVPDPSIFRTHPHTKDRIARLQELNPQQYQPVALPAQSPFALPGNFNQVTRQPSWHTMHLWY
ncbi:MAG: M48 family metalloprotease [Caldilineaceae bacterium]|nr:M48 family metalloprotease [Caldilineaceae bacterium]